MVCRAVELVVRGEVDLAACREAVAVLPLAPGRDDAGAPSSAEHPAVERSRLSRDLEHHLHDGTTWHDPCAGPASSRDAATGADR